MGLFSRKKPVDYDTLFKEKYKNVNQIMQNAHNEMDYVIKEALMKNVIAGYDELLNLIGQGACFDKEHFQSLKMSALKELEDIQAINQDI